jgi:hypothetical protein
MRQAKSKKLAVELSEQEILNKLLANMTSSIDPNKVFYVGTNNGENVYRLAGKKLNAGQASLLRNEAQMLEKMQLWKIFTETLKNEAHQRMWEKMVTLEDSHYGKALLHAISVFSIIVEKLQQIEITPKPPHVYEPRPHLSTSES